MDKCRSRQLSWPAGEPNYGFSVFSELHIFLETKSQSLSQERKAMSLRILRRASQSQNAKQLSSAIFFSKITRSFLQSKPYVNLKEESSWFWYLIGSNSDQFCSSSFAIAFDIDGVVLRSEIPIGGSPPQAIRRLYDDSGTLIFHAHLYYLFICLFNLGNCFVKVKL